MAPFLALPIIILARGDAVSINEATMTDKCIRCGSTKIIPEAALLDHYGDMGMTSDHAQVEVHARPGAWFFTDSALGTVTLRICGECGYAELQVSNHRELYEKYERSLKK
jgi:hypothetical protein